jgi:hypothetical protein
MPELSVNAETGLDQEALRAHLHVELTGVAGPERIEVDRAGSNVRVKLTFADGTEEREIALRDVARPEIPRVISLVVSEAARAHLAKATAVPTPPAAASSAPPPQPSPSAPPPASSPARRVLLGAEAAFGVRAFRGGQNVALEPRVAGFLRLASGVRFDAGAFYLTSSETDPLGGLTLRGIGGSMAASLERELASSLFARLGPRVDIGSAFGRGASSGVAIEGRASEPLVLLVGEIAARYRVGPLSIVVAGDAGGVLSGIGLGVDERTPLAWNGATFGGRLGLALE